MTTTQWLFSFQGRMGRKHFWVWNLFYYAILGGVSATAANGLLGPLAGPIIAVFALVLFIPDLAVTAKRWHDRNKSNWWLLLHVPLIGGRLYAPEVGGAAIDAGGIETVIAAFGLVCGLWVFIECGFMKGDEGPNHYGEPEVIYKPVAETSHGVDDKTLFESSESPTEKK